MVPAVGNNVTVSVASSDWMVPGQKVVVQGPATFTVVSLPNSQSAVLQFAGYVDDVAPTTTITAGASVGPSGTQPALPSTTPLKVYAAGTPYQLTVTSQLLDFGTTDPSLAITTPGTWLILARARIDYNAATFAAVRTVTLKLRRTNNTASDIADSTAAFKTQIITTLTFTAAILDLQPIIYTTSNSNDVLEIWGSIDTGPTAGSIDAVEASIVAIRLS